MTQKIFQLAVKVLTFTQTKDGSDRSWFANDLDKWVGFAAQKFKNVSLIHPWEKNVDIPEKYLPSSWQ